MKRATLNFFTFKRMLNSEPAYGRQHMTIENNKYNHMKKLIPYILLFNVLTANAQTKAFKKGEWLKYRVSYSNFFNAGSATLEVKEAKNKKAFHIVGKAKTSGVISWFFKVKDNYQSYFDKKTTLPYRFVRKINEGGYTKNKEIYFNQPHQIATVKDYKHKTEKKFTTYQNVHDMLSTLYFLRNKDISTMKPGHQVSLTMFFDEKNYPFKLKFLGREVIKTKFGKVAVAKFRPIVQSGRVFKENESLTVWVTDDENKMPIRIKASLAVGSMRVDLDAYKGLANPFPIIF